MSEGSFIVLEGVDGAGTTTHTKQLCKALRQAQGAVHTTAEPSNGPIGALLRQALMGRMVISPESGAVHPPGWGTMALLFAADRLDHIESEVQPALRKGTTVICDRYYHSSVAYQSITGGGHDAIAWIREINRDARVPDLTIVLDVPPEVAAERRRGRGPTEIFDGDALQRELCAFYAELEQHFPGERIVHLDAVGTLEEVAQRVLALVADQRAI